MAARTNDAGYMRLLAELGANPLLAGVGMSAAEDGETEGQLPEASSRCGGIAVAMRKPS